MPNIDTVWSRVVAHEGATFHQIRGQAFQYKIHQSVLNPSTTNQKLHESEFEKALDYLPMLNTIPLQKLRGPSYLYAILIDKRIRAGDW
jgi:hypothetical protein